MWNTQLAGKYFKKMGEHLGLMYQIMDDSNDIDTDDAHKNIWLI